MLEDYSGLIDIFVYCYDLEARCAFIFYLFMIYDQNYEYFTNSKKP